MEIIQSCLFTILICTWSVQHLNVPGPKDGRVTILVRKIRWMIITILFPEFLLAHAIMERDMAFKSMCRLKDLDTFVIDDRSWWTAFIDRFSRPSNLGHSSKPVTAKIAREDSDSQHEMRIIRSPNENRVSQTLSQASICDSDIEANPSELSVRSVQNSSSSSDSQPDDHDQQPEQASLSSSTSEVPIQWTLVHSYYANMGGLRLRCPVIWNDKGPITTERLASLLQKRYIGVDELRDLSISSIVDKSKGDFFTKGLAVMQVLWLMITLLIRASRNLAVTQLEILASAFAICSALTYGFRWNKPQDVQNEIIIRGCSHFMDKTQQHCDSLSTVGRPDSIVKALLAPLSRFYLPPKTFERIANDNFEQTYRIIQPVVIALAVSTVSHGIFQLFKYPSKLYFRNSEQHQYVILNLTKSIAF